MATTDFIAAIELSSSKISGIAGKKNSDGSMQVLAYAREDATPFIRKGGIYNIDKAAQALTTIKERLEHQLNNSIAKVYVGIGGQSLRTAANTVSRVLEEEGIISQGLIDEICDENRSTVYKGSTPSSELTVLEVAPQEYKIDNRSEVEPVGVTGRQVIGQFLNIVARTALQKNLEHSLEQAGIEIADDVLVAPVALAKAVLTESEMRSGCALVDFGADTTTVMVYKNNILRFLSVLPLGGNNITRDIASLQMEEEDAEKLKLKYGDALYEEEEESGDTPALCKMDDGRTVELSTLNNIVGARAEEILANVWNQLKLSGYEDKLFSGIVFTGGASNLKNLEKAFTKLSKVEKVKTVKFVQDATHGYADMLKKDGMSNTLLGLLLAGRENCGMSEADLLKEQGGRTANVQGNMFDNDEALREQEAAARAAKAQREKEERERKERERKEKEQREKERQEKKKKKDRPNWFDRTFSKLSNEIFSDDDMK